MKKLFLFCFLCLVSANMSLAQRFKASDFANVGVEHNRLLEVAYNTIVSKKITNETKRDLIPVLQNSLEDVQVYSKPDLELAMQNLSNVGKEVINIDKNFYSFKNSSQIDKRALKYYDKLYSIVMREGITSKDLNTAVERLETEIYNDKDIDNKNLLIFYSGTNVAKYSTLYWEENADNWESLNSGNQALARAGGGRRVAGADVGGAIGGAVTCWMANMVPGAGQVAYGTAIATGAVGASIGEAFNQFMDWAGW